MFKLSRESIQMQSPIFFKELSLAIESLRNTSSKDMETCEEVTLVETVIHHHTNMKVKIVICDFGPAVNFQQVTKNHPLVDPISKLYANNKEVLKLISANKELRGSVDLSNGKVHGFFTDLGAQIYLPYGMLKGSRFTNEEIAATVLHEIGHVFTYCEYIVRSVTTNQVLAAMSRELSGAETEKEREVILINTAKALKLSEKGLRELSKSTNTKVTEAVVVTGVVEECRSELGYDIYDTTSWEYLSDEFAARFQASRHLVTALDKIYRDFGHISFRSTPTFLAYEAFKLLVLMMTISPIGPLALTAAFIMIACDGHNPTYDMPGARMHRVKNQIIEGLKDKKLPKEEAAKLLEDLKFIDELAEHVNDRRQFLGVVFDWLTPGAGKGRDFTKMQQELEALANNELFAKAVEFKSTI